MTFKSIMAPVDDSWGRRSGLPIVRIVTCCFMLFVLGEVSAASDTPSSPPSAALAPAYEISNQVVQLALHEKYAEAAKLFHYPPSYTASELATDRNGVTDLLRETFAAIGPITRADVHDFPLGRFILIGIQGGDDSYWASRPELGHSLDVTFKVEALKHRDVYFVVQLIRPGDKWEVRSFILKTLASAPGAAEFLASIAKRFNAQVHKP